MITLDLNDKYLAENAKAIQELRELGIFTEEQLQKMYDEQVQKDISRDAEESESER